MTTFTLEFDNASDVEEAIHHLWERLALTGELSTKAVADGHWRLQVVTEKPLRPQTLEKVKGRRVDE
jgi:hypothetical protein